MSNPDRLVPFLSALTRKAIRARAFRTGWSYFHMPPILSKYRGLTIGGIYSELTMQEARSRKQA